MPAPSPQQEQEATTRGTQDASRPEGRTWAGTVDGLPVAATEVLRLLDEARDRTFDLVGPVSEEDWFATHDPVMGPVAWDVVHMGNQEEIWCCQTLGGRDEMRPGYNRRYHAYRNPRPRRARLPLLSKEEALAYRREVARATAEVLAAHAPRADTDDPHWRDLYVHRMIVLHEHQHGETILQAVYGFPKGRYRPEARRPAPRAAHAPTDADHAGSPASRFVHHEGGAFTMGLPRQAWTYDNEWPPTEVRLDPFWLAAHPVTNAQWLAFIESGGYEEAEWWDPVGHEKLMERGWRAPAYWIPRPDGWHVRACERTAPVEEVADRPVMNITWYEADAFARWAGMRLPTEAEWEYATTWDPATATKRRWPWGDDPWTPAHANLDQARFTTDPVGSHPEGATPAGVHQLVGDVWEWTASEFRPYPGYAPFPYREYSEKFYDSGLMVLRGGSWATRPRLRLGTFRNWDLPVRRQVFSGLRLAADAPDGTDVPPTLRSGSLGP